jgi:hypothetical protein
MNLGSEEMNSCEKVLLEILTSNLTIMSKVYKDLQKQKSRIAVISGTITGVENDTVTISDGSDISTFKVKVKRNTLNVTPKLGQFMLVYGTMKLFPKAYEDNFDLRDVIEVEAKYAFIEDVK